MDPSAQSPSSLAAIGLRRYSTNLRLPQSVASKGLNENLPPTRRHDDVCFPCGLAANQGAGALNSKNATRVASLSKPCLLGELRNPRLKGWHPADVASKSLDNDGQIDAQDDRNHATVIPGTSGRRRPCAHSRFGLGCPPSARSYGPRRAGPHHSRN